MLFDGSESDEMKYRSDCRVNSVVEFPSFLVNQPRGFDELRRAVEVLLEEHRRLDATRIPLKDRGPVLQVRHDVVGDFQIITEQVEFRELLVGPVNTIQARNCHLLAAHLYDQVAFGPVQAEKLFDG